MTMLIMAFANTAISAFFVYMAVETRGSHFYALAVFNGLCAIISGMQFAERLQ